eukprot:Hpha_TRINITY_DN16907_c0_g1::TRINITY_DN16907_c0_g1_i10::g.54021::m.54021
MILLSVVCAVVGDFTYTFLADSSIHGNDIEYTYEPADASLTLPTGATGSSGSGRMPLGSTFTSSKLLTVAGICGSQVCEAAEVSRYSGTRFAWAPRRGDAYRLFISTVDSSTASYTVTTSTSSSRAQPSSDTVSPGASPNVVDLSVDVVRVEIEATGGSSIMVGALARDNGAWSSTMDYHVLAPAAEVIYGAHSKNANIVVFGENSVSVTQSCSDGSTGTYSGTIMNVAGGEGLYAGKACKYSVPAGSFIAGYTMGDGDGTAGTAFIPSSMFGKYAVLGNFNFIKVIAAEETQCILTDTYSAEIGVVGSGSSVKEGYHKPNSAVAAGTRIECNADVMLVIDMTFSSLEGKETNFLLDPDNRPAWPSMSPITPSPSVAPTTSAPSISPTSSSPTAAPTSSSPTLAPTTSAPSRAPTTSLPTVAPSTSSPTISPSTPPTASPTKLPTTSVPTISPSTSPTVSPTVPPTPHPCQDGSHGCHDVSAGGICIQQGNPGNGQTGWKCDCDSNYWCSAGCSGAHTAHTCTLKTSSPTHSPTTSPSVSPTTSSPTTPPTMSPSTSSPTVSPTVPPTPHPCQDGSHGCHDVSAGGICIQQGNPGNGQTGWKCDCDSNYWCSAGCSGAHTAHTCTLKTS